MSRRKPITLTERDRARFETKYEPEPMSGCWLWTACCTKDGYGRFLLGSRATYRAMHLAHRLSWALYRGPIPSGMHVLHTCDVPGCVNPGHLWLGTDADNHLDMERKRRGRRSKMGMPPGVARHRSGCFMARIRVGGKTRHLGCFATPEEASAAVEAARVERGH